VFTNDDPLNATDPLGQWGGGYPRSDWKKELKVWGTGSASNVIGIGLGLVASGAAIVVIVAATPEVAAGAAIVAGVSGVGAEALDAKNCIVSHDSNACPGAILGLGGVGVVVIALLPAESGFAIAAKAASTVIAPAVGLTDALIDLLTSSSKKTTTVTKKTTTTTTKK
jgi:hypothetical protein